MSVRLTQDDIISADLNKPGVLKKLWRKLHRTGKKRRSPGSACTRCRLAKTSCDAGMPCSNCVLAGEICIKDEARGPSSTDNVEREFPNHPEQPISQGVRPCRSPQAVATDPMCPSLGGIGMLLDCGLSYGLRADDVSRMIGSCPRKLRTALHRLSCVIPYMLQNQAVKRKPLPELDAVFESDQISCWHARFEPDGSTVCLFNDQAAFQYGVHGEELAARFPRRDVPMVKTEYRTLCNQLDLLYQLCFNEAGSFDIFSPFCRFKAGGEQGEHWLIHRKRCQLYADGVRGTAVLISAEEYDRGIAQRRDALGLFTESTLLGSELFSAQGLFPREQIASLAAREEGRRVLDELADKVVACFRLDPLPPFAVQHPATPLPSVEHFTFDQVNQPA